MSLFVKTFRAAGRVSYVQRSIARRCLSDGLKERERAAEAAFFNQEDAAALKQLQEKLRLSKQTQTGGNSAVDAVVTSEIDELRSMIAPHNLPQEKLQAIVDWKHNLL